MANEDTLETPGLVEARKLAMQEGITVAAAVDRLRQTPKPEKMKQDKAKD